jgi:hypothetical protein
MPGSCSAAPSKSSMLPLSLPLSVSVIMSVPNSGLNVGSALWRSVRTAAYRLDDDDALAATRMEGAAILTSTSSIGFFVQAWVT